MKPRLTLVAASLAALSLNPDALAQANPALSPVVVAATRSALPLTEVLADVSVVDRDEIERSGATSVSDVLARLPGITITQTGGPASTTGVFVRGAENRFTAVFIDGVRIDTQSSGGAAWEALPLAQIERMEVLRGPAAAVYGSDAVAGVVHIFSRQGEPGFFPSVRVGVGSHQLLELNASLRGGSGNLDYSLGLAEDSSTGYNGQPSSTNPDRDGYRNQSFSGRLGWRLASGQKLELTALDNQQKAAYDAFGSIPPTDDIARRHLQTLGLNWTARWSDTWNTRVGLTQGTDRYESTPSVYLTQTQVRTALVRNELSVGPGLLTADLEHRQDALTNSSMTPLTDTGRHQDALAVGYGLRAGDHSLQVNARRDNDSEFGGKSTGALAYGYALTSALRVTASTGTAFRMPTLYQRFSPYGNPALKPESSGNQEIGLRWTAAGQRASAVVYRNTVQDLINFDAPGTCASPFGCYRNTGHARMSGATLTAGMVVGELQLGGSLDLMEPKNLDTDRRLARRARTQALLNADLPVGGWRLSAEVQHVGERFDNATNTARLAAYSLVHLSASTALGKDWRLQARVNNLADRDYVLAQGYATPGRTVYVGLTWAPSR